MKEIYRQRDESHPPRRRDRGNPGNRKGGSYGARSRRRRLLVGAALITLLLLGVVALANYLLGDDGLLRTSAEEEVAPVEESGQQQSAVSEGEAGEGAAAEDDATGGQPSVLLGEYFTDYAWDPDEGRQSNLKTAAGAIDNTILKPGEEFSAVEALSHLEYEPAKVFANGGVDYEVGGGLCQVSSTLFMAANYAGLEITERNPHYAELPYIRPGLDATVWFGNVEDAWGSLDMKFKNTTDGDILIRQFVNEDGFMVAEIYGEEPTNKTVSMTSEKVEEDLSKGITWATYKQVEEDGEIVEDGVLFETTYSYNPPVPEEYKHETHEPRGSGWVDVSNTTNWNDKD